MPLTNELEKGPILVECIAPEGLGFGHGSISVQERIASGDLSRHDMATAEGIIRSEEGMTAIESDDDGCSDGRDTASIIKGADRYSADTKKQRAKIFGGGSAMATAGLIGNGAINPKEDNLTDAFEYGMFRLEEAGLDFGAHTVTNCSDGKSGCGAIDEAPAIIENIGRYREEITKAVDTVIDPAFDRTELGELLNESFDNFAVMHESESKVVGEEAYQGGSILSKLLKRNKKVAELADSHNEVAIVVSTDIDDMTADQGAVRNATDGKAQIFPIDAARLKRISDELFEYDHDKKQALVSMLVYTFSVSATLTKGDLPTFVAHRGQPFVSLDFSQQ